MKQNFIRQGKTRVYFSDTIKLKPEAIKHPSLPKRGKLHEVTMRLQENCVVKDGVLWTADSLRKGALAKYRRCEFKPADARNLFSWAVRRLLKHNLLEVTRAPANEKD